MMPYLFCQCYMSLQFHKIQYKETQGGDNEEVIKLLEGRIQ